MTLAVSGIITGVVLFTDTVGSPHAALLDSISLQFVLSLIMRNLFVRPIRGLLISGSVQGCITACKHVLG